MSPVNLSVYVVVFLLVNLPPPVAEAKPGAPPAGVAEIYRDLVLTTAGPDGQPMQLFTTRTFAGGRCDAVLLPNEDNKELDAECTTRSGSAEQTLPLSNNLDGTCILRDNRALFRGGVAIVEARGATRITWTEGRVTRSAPVVDGLSAVWVGQSAPGEHWTISSYSASGDKIDTVAVVIPCVVPPDPQSLP